MCGTTTHLNNSKESHLPTTTPSSIKPNSGQLLGGKMFEGYRNSAQHFTCQSPVIHIIHGLQVGNECLQLSSRFMTVYALIFLFALMILVFGNTPVSATLCRISGVSYNFPREAMPGAQVHVDTTVAGSCAANGQQYYLLRANLIEKSSTRLLSSNQTPIGYDAENFTVTVTNLATTPLGANFTWPLEVDVYVINAGSGGGSYMYDYSTKANISIEVGPTAMPEFPRQTPVVVLLAGTIALTFFITKRQRQPRNRKELSAHDLKNVGRGMR